MITTTPIDRLYRVEFDMIHSDVSKTGIVCFLYLVDSGIRIYYHHHIAYHRQVAKGPWSKGSIIRQPVNGALRAIIESGLFAQVWSEARTEEILAWPGDPERDSVEEVNLGI
jgi:hypothetical protein